ncbi:MAG TPA: STAS domain-containing protein [Actinocrinis sp.]|nr:STAS domain-containing protein [Actinocrinis sp.]
MAGSHPEFPSAESAGTSATGAQLLTARLPREVDAANEARVRLDLLAMLDAYAPQIGGLIIDMTTTKFIDSSGLRALLAIRDRAAELSAPLYIAAPSNEVRRFLSLVDITGRIPVFDTVDAALVACSARPELTTATIARPFAGV